MYLHTSHPHYSAEMELLASLPPEPGVANAKLLARDMGLHLTRDIRAMVKRLRDKGYAIGSGRDALGNGLNLGLDTLDRARADAQDYWHCVYGA